MYLIAIYLSTFRTPFSEALAVKHLGLIPVSHPEHAHRVVGGFFRERDPIRGPGTGDIKAGNRHRKGGMNLFKTETVKIQSLSSP